jgi:hypothetical protein
MRACARRNNDEGQAVVLVLAVAVVVVLCMVAVGRFGARLVRIEQAQVAADAAALAGLDGGRDAAAALARANTGTLVAFHQLGDDVLVTVVVDGVQASARASRAP